ncbi:MAG: NADH-quinone oxidoreductase subunit NuoG [Pseudomonadota bacterium]
MSDQSDNIVNIEVDGQPVEAKKGQMVIEATDACGAYVPRFCYHEKLSIAANCRMCLVEVEKAPKPLPACATPVGEGMKIFTKSPKAISAQKATMEFLLINHPLDCPICDQGGECELQDLAMGYGRDVSRYQDGKRVVKDKDIGPLVSTDMTRCIHCTRCVRFGEEVTGNQQLGTTERGENMKIGTYVEKSIDHEMSANIIDLCPVGALNNKPYRYSARAWEMVQRSTISPHDCVGSNLYAHVLRGTVKRIVPRPAESINETWISDRDRFSYEAVYSDDRLATPMIKEGGEWRSCDWEEALEKAATGIKAAGNKAGLLASPSATVEEGVLFAKLAEQIGSTNIDHRLRRRDFTDQDADAVVPGLGCEIPALEEQDAVLMVGSNVRHEAPIIAHRLRKAALKGCAVSFANSELHEYFFDVHAYAQGNGLVNLLASVIVAASGGKKVPATVNDLCDGVAATDEAKAIADSLNDADEAMIVLGNVAGRHEARAAIAVLADALAEMTGAAVGELTEGANTAGLHIAGVLPHRTAGGHARAASGQHAVDMCAGEMDAMLLLNLEPGLDMPALSSSKMTVALTAFDSNALRDVADVLLPIGTFAETSGTYVNVAGTWQSFSGVANPVGDSRPAWKVLRVLLNLVGAEDAEYLSSEEVLEELKATIGGGYGDAGKRSKPAHVNGEDDPAKEVDIPLYSGDGLVRRAEALQLTPEARRARGEH